MSLHALFVMKVKRSVHKVKVYFCLQRQYAKICKRQVKKGCS